MRPISEALLERLRNRQAVLVAGHGCSRLAGLPDWRTLATRLAEHLSDTAEKQAVVGMIETGEIATAMAVLRSALPEPDLAHGLQLLLPAPEQVPAPIQALAEAPWRGIIATGLDPLWAAAAGQSAAGSLRPLLADQAPTLEAAHGRFLLQIFGRTDVPTSLCLAPVEIGAKVASPGAAELVLALHKKWSFVFVGFTPGDPDLVLFAGRVLAAATSTVEHFLLAPELSELELRKLKADYGLTGVASEAPLDETLAALASACAVANEKPGVDDAEAWLERASKAPDDVESVAGLERAVAELREHGQWERLVAILLARSDIVGDAKAQAADLREAGLVLDRQLAAPERAWAALTAALHLTPHDAALLADARPIAERAKHDKEFLDELATIEAQCNDPAEAVALRLCMAGMLAEDGARREEASAVYQKILDHDPGNAEASAGLEALLRKSERWEALATFYQKQRERAPEDVLLEAKLEDAYRRARKIEPLIALLRARLDKGPDDQDARRRLEDLYGETQRWQALAEHHEGWLEIHPDDRDTLAKLEALHQKTQAWAALGALYARTLARHPDDVETAKKAEELYRRTADWRALVDLLERRAEREDAAAARALRLEGATILVDKLQDIEAALKVARGFAANDPSAAEEIFAKCLDRAPGNADALLALSSLARDRGDYLRAAKFILDAAERTQNPLELGRLHAEAGGLYLHCLGDEAKAVTAFERALAADPEQVTAARELLVLREKAEDWAGAEPLVDLLVHKTPDDVSGAKCDLYVRQAQNARRLGKLDKAAAAFAAASALSPGLASLALAHADFAFERQAWAEARTQYQRARELMGDAACAEERSRLWERLGACAAELRDLEAAASCYGEALAILPDKADTIAALIDVRTQRREWHEKLALERRLLALPSSPSDKARILDEIGDVLRDKLGDAAAALEAYREALALEPERRPTLYKLLEHLTQEKQWPEAVETLQKLAGLESEPAARAKLNYASAAIYRDELADVAKATALFAKVLDDEPLHAKALEAIEKLLRDGQDWKELERAYRKQLKRLPPEASNELRLRLWDKLADVALRQHDKESAALTMEVAVSLDPDNLVRQERLANLYFSMGAQGADKAIAYHQALLARKPARIDSYKALAALFFQAGAHDKMWCVAGAMTCMGKADPPLRALYENYRPMQMATAPVKLTQDLWRRVVHPDENPHLSALFALLSPALAMTTAKSHKAFGIDRNARLDLVGNSWSYAAALRHAASVAETPLPDVYVKRDALGTINLVNLKEKAILVPALIVGLGFDQLWSQSQVVFDLAKRIVQLRPERFPRFTLGTPSALDIAVRAGLQLGGSPIGAGAHGDAVDKLAKQLDGLLSAPLRSELKVLAKRYVEACGDRVEIDKWIVASDLTASRAALAICGDVGAAAHVLAIEPSGQSPLPVAERIYDLLAYFVSEDHFAVRAALGLQVSLTPPAPDPQPGRRARGTRLASG